MIAKSAFVAQTGRYARPVLRGNLKQSDWGRKLRVQRHASTVTLRTGEPEPPSDAQDLDRKWQEFKKKLETQRRTPDPEPRKAPRSTPLSVQEIDRKTERLTNVWTSQAGYLFGAGFILAVAAFYLYVMKEQGIF
jgi:hypothetical protein